MFASDDSARQLRPWRRRALRLHCDRSRVAGDRAPARTRDETAVAAVAADMTRRFLRVGAEEAPCGVGASPRRREVVPLPAIRRDRCGSAERMGRGCSEATRGRRKYGRLIAACGGRAEVRRIRPVPSPPCCRHIATSTYSPRFGVLLRSRGATRRMTSSYTGRSKKAVTSTALPSCKRNNHA